MNFGTLNVQSCRTKLSEIIHDLDKHNYKIITLMETKKKETGSEMHKITVLGVYGVSNDTNRDEKEKFFDELNQEIAKIGNNRELIIMGDLNGRTGRRIGSEIIGLMERIL
ncbi:uncharacterized protein LOC123318912 [Coccinella septempunctata]|uniref:uncharacterized protein LOC123318912 n=1 Tax=Coccinella septempunctata TaxID=41139 RepID=UPI001D08CBD8|nr:uncharacterized protein LOC123318912 [Coccinella septempunctata]